MSAQARIVIKGENQLKGPLKQAESDLKSFGQTAQKVGKMIDTASVILAVVAAIKALTEVVSDCTKEFKEQIEVDTRLDAVIKATGQQYKFTTKDIKNYSQALQEQTRFGDDVIEQSAQLLVATQKFSKEGLERTLELSADLAEAMGTDLTSATSTLSKALIEPGEGLNRLKSIGISFTDAEEDMIKKLRDAGDELGAQQAILDKVEAAYGGVAKSIGSIDTSTLDKIKNVWGDIKENLGNAFQNALGPVFNWIYQTLRWLERLTSQVAERSNFNKYLREGNANFLADNFTADYLQKEIDKRLNSEAYTNPTNNNWLKYYLQKNQIAMSDFLQMESRQQLEFLEKWAGPGNTDMVGEINRMLVEYRNSAIEVQTMRNALLKQEQDVLKGIELAEANAAAESAAAFQTTLDGALNEFGKLSETFKIKELDDKIAEVVKLLESDDLGAFNRTVLEEALQDLRLQRYTYDTNPVKTDMQFEISGIDPFGMNSINNLMSPANLLKTGLNAGILSDKIAESNQFWGDLNTALEKYGSKSVSLQARMLQEEIDKVSTLLESSFLDSNSPTATYLTEIKGELEDQLDELVNGNKTEAKLITFLDKLGSKIGTSLGGLFGATDEQSGAAGASIISSFTSQMGEAGEVVSRLATNMATMGPLLGAIVTALHYVIGGLMETLQEVFNDFIKWGIEPLKELGRMVGQILLPIFKEIMPSVIASGKVLMQLFQSLARLLAPIVQILMRVVGPVLTALADVLVTIVGTISWAIDWLAYCITWVLNKVSFGWIEQTAKPGGLNDYLSGMYADPSGTYETSESLESTGAASAAYSGGTIIHMHNYFTGSYIVGSGGMRELALIIRNTLEDVDYAGQSI